MANVDASAVFVRRRLSTGQTGANAACAKGVGDTGTIAQVRPTMKTDALDHYLAQCVKSFVQSLPVPHWPADIEAEPDEIATRVSYHGIALLLVEASPDLTGWPVKAVETIKEEARLQSFWEMSHRSVTGKLVEALHDAGITALLLKGTALAYSVYPKSEYRRRGDSDLLIEDADRSKTRAVFEACGLSQWSDVRPLQECWQSETTMGFDHTFDLHWRISASSAISGLLEANLPRRRPIPLPHLSPNARGIGPIDNLLLICVNRAQHSKFGYQVGESRLFENDRLIWALDIELMTAEFDTSDWNDVVASATASGSTDIVHSVLQMAQRLLGTSIPMSILEELERHANTGRLTAYLESNSGRERLMLDLAASPTLRDKARLLGFKLYPSEDLILERFPDADGWPIAMLRMRRFVSWLGNLLRGRA